MERKLKDNLNYYAKQDKTVVVNPHQAELKVNLKKMSYNLTKQVNYSFPETLKKVKAELSKEGFGVISEIDLKEKFKETLSIEFREYRILGACNPKLAHQAIEKEDKIGVLLPCNILVQEKDKETAEVTAVNPMETMSAVNNPELKSIAHEVSQKLQRVIESL